MTAQEQVRLYWSRVFGPEMPGTLHIGIEGAGPFPTWESAAEFTERHEEECRQLKREIACQNLYVTVIYQMILAKVDTCYDTGLDSDVVHLCVHSRILARLESALAEMQRGVREEAR